MTAQIPEKLLYKGEKLDMCCEPLEPYLRQTKKVLNYSEMSTACWRGYRGTWEFIDNQLCLVNIKANIFTNSGERAVTIQDYFPGARNKVFAHWFTGEIRCIKGALLDYVHGGYGSTYEEDLFIECKGGILIGERLVINGKDEKGLPTGAVIAGYMTSPNNRT